LAFKVENRWQDARSFRRALWHTRTRKYKRKAALFTAGGVLAGAAVIGSLSFALRSEKPLSDVAILPFAPGPGIEMSGADRLTQLTAIHLGSFARVADQHDVAAWWHEHGPHIDSIPRSRIHELDTQYLVLGVVAVGEGDTSVTVAITDRRGRQHAPIIERLGAGRRLDEIGHRVGFDIAQVIDPNRASEYVGSLALMDKTDRALALFLDGLRAFKRNGFKAATDLFAMATQEDPQFFLAEWWWSNSSRWMGSGEPADIDLRHLLDTHRVDLPELDRLLIEAQLAPSQQERYEGYRRAIQEYPRNGYAHFLYAEELQSKGAHIGVPLEESTRQLEIAAQKDPNLGPAHQSLIWSYVRLGRREEAESSFAHYREVEPAPDEVDMPSTPLWELMIVERFYPGRADSVRRALFTQPGMTAELQDQDRFRRASSYDLAATQADFGELFLTMDPGADLGRRGLYHKGRAMGLMGLGRISEALFHLDSSAVLFGTPSAAIAAAQWRVLGPILGLPGFSNDQVAKGRIDLEELVTDRTVGLRAAWSLGSEAAQHGDTSATRRWLDSLRTHGSDTTAQRLAHLLESMDAASRDDFWSALSLSEHLLPYDSAARGGDSFARAVLHLKRAEWHEILGNPAAADTARLWYEHFEWLDNRRPDALQAAEIDWALSTHARFLRGWAAANRGDQDTACRYLLRVLELWAEADAAYQPHKDRAMEFVERRCSS
jgi:hypothetical protein